jgi:tRNA (guanosine-2'-O-)-methyltransferase
MTGAGRKTPPAAEDLLLQDRKERIDQVVSLRTRTLTLVLDRLEDSFNMAAVLRTAEGLGIQEVHVIAHPDYRFAPSDKVTQGCEKWMDIQMHKDFGSCRLYLKERGFALWASARAPQSKSLLSLRFDGKLALIFGNERTGVSAEAAAGADGTFWIPMRGFTQSLNVSAAAAATLTRAIGWREEHWGHRGDLTPDEARELTERFYRLSVKQRTRIYSF